MIAIYIGTAPMLSKLWLMLIAVPAIAAVPLAYVWGGKALRLGGNWINGFALSFSSAYLIGLAASQFVSLQSAVEIGSGAGILLFFVLYPLLFGGWERLTQGSRFELAILGLLKAGFARADSEVSVISGLCVEVWVYLQNTVPDFLYRTWTDTWNWIQRVFRRFGG